MKYIKTFEVKIVEKLDVGDYVLMCQKLNTSGQNYKNFIDNNIGKIMDIHERESVILLTYENIPEELLFEFRERKIGDIIFYGKWFNMLNIVEHGKTKEEVELKIHSKKYNL